MLAVGDSTTLEVRFSTSSYTSCVTKRPKIVTNEDSGASHYVQIRTCVCDDPALDYFPLKIDPVKIDLVQHSDSLTDEVTVQITNASGQPLTLTAVDVPQDYLELTLPDVLAPGQTREAVVRIEASVIQSVFAKSITIEVNDAASNRFTIPVSNTYNPGT